MSHWKTAVIALAFGVTGMLLGLGTVHLYTDHALLHEVVNFINANAAKQNGAPRSTP